MCYALGHAHASAGYAALYTKFALLARFRGTALWAHLATTCSRLCSKPRTHCAAEAMGHALPWAQTLARQQTKDKS